KMQCAAAVVTKKISKGGPIAALRGASTLVVGASSSVGKAIVTRLAFSGQRVIGISEDSPRLRSIEEEMKKVGANVSCIPYQESEERTIEKAVSLTADGITGLVYVPPDNNVTGDIADSTTTEFNTVFAHRLTLPFRVIKASLPHLRKSEDSSIVIVNSSAAYTPFIDLGLFSASSTALLSMARVIALECPVRVNTVVMSTVRGDGSGGVWDKDDDGSSLRAMMPLSRLGSTADVAAAVEFLQSKRARYITGESLILNGGVHLRL
ncbi:hypothetical protein PMAYCL1PPCAC_23807, partial [Pristionchus mayeri]